MYWKGGYEMTLLEDWKKKTEKGLKVIKEKADGIAFNVEKLAKIAKRKRDIVRIQRRTRKLYSEIGEYVYDECTMEKPLTNEAPFLKERVSSISQMKVDVKKIEAEIEEMRKMQPPKTREKTQPELAEVDSKDIQS
jgi:hypothetical protein